MEGVVGPLEPNTKPSVGYKGLYLIQKMQILILSYGQTNEGPRSETQVKYDFK